MAHFIDKDALVEKIERRTKYNHERAYLDKSPSMAGRENEDKDILSLIDTLDVTEVDLEKEYEEFVVNDPVYNKLVNGIVGKAIAKYFYSLGLKAQKGK